MQKPEREKHVKTLRAADAVCVALGKADPSQDSACQQVRKGIADLKACVMNPHLKGHLRVSDRNGIARSLSHWAKVADHQGKLDEAERDAIEKAIAVLSDASNALDGGALECLISEKDELVDAAVHFAQAPPVKKLQSAKKQKQAQAEQDERAKRVRRLGREFARKHKAVLDKPLSEGDMQAREAING